MKRKDGMCSFIAPKSKVGEIENKQLNKVDGQDEVEE